jgi:hypothetical protein
VRDLLAEPNARELVLDQHDELMGLPLPLEPDVGRMTAGEERGVYKIWSCRRDGLLIGFIEFHISPTFHHRSTLFGIDGGHYTHPSFCTAWQHLRMWRSGIEALKALGVKVVLAHDGLRPMDAFFKRLGFQPAGQMYARVIDAS